MKIVIELKNDEDSLSFINSVTMLKYYLEDSMWRYIENVDPTLEGKVASVELEE